MPFFLGREYNKNAKYFGFGKTLTWFSEIHVNEGRVLTKHTVKIGFLSNFSESSSLRKQTIFGFAEGKPFSSFSLSVFRFRRVKKVSFSFDDTT